MVIMKLVFVTGLADVDRKTIIDLAIQRTGRNSKFMVVDLDRLGNIGSDVAEAKDSGEVQAMLSAFQDQVEKIMISGLKDQKDNIIVNGLLTIDTPYGYVMPIPQDFFEAFKPDNVVILETETDDDRTNQHQMVNRFYGARYSSKGNSFLRIIRFREGKIMEAVSDLSEVIKH